MTVEITRTGPDLGVILDRIAKDLSVESADLVMEAAQHATSEIRRELYRTVKGGRGGLARSYHEVFLGTAAGVTAAASTSDLEYARVQDSGGRIKARIRRNLAIPLKRMAVGKWPSTFPEGALTFIPSDKPDVAGILAKVSKRGKIDPFFVLKRSVKIPGSHYVSKAAKNAEQGIDEILGKGVTKIVDDAVGAG